MNDAVVITVSLLALLVLICLIALEILFARNRRMDREIEQCNRVIRAIEQGASHEELMKMEMPKALRKKLEEIKKWEDANDKSRIPKHSNK